MVTNCSGPRPATASQAERTRAACVRVCVPVHRSFIAASAAGLFQGREILLLVHAPVPALLGIELLCLHALEHVVSKSDLML
jgi:hypothetical protein